MTRLSYRFYRLATALTYHLPRRLTKAGLLVLAGMILTGAIGSDMDQSVAFQAFALLLCLLTVATVRARFFQGAFVVERSLPRVASAGQPFRYRVRVHNQSKRGYRDLEILEDLADPRPTLQQFAQAMPSSDQIRTFRLAAGVRPHFDYRQAIVAPAALPEVAPGGTADVQLQVMPLRRGPLRFKGISVARRDPLGLVRGLIRMTLPQTVLVLPKRYRVNPLALPSARHYQPGGVPLASSVGESEEFVSLRDYRPGDAFRRIHWRSWARVGRPIVKEYQDEFFVRHALVLDTFLGSAHPEAFEEAVSVAASFACSMETQESLLDLIFVGSQAFHLTSGRGLGQSEQVLQILASVRPSSEQRLNILRELVLRHADVLSACICVFVAWDEARRELVRRLQERGLPVLTLFISDEKSGRLVQQDNDGDRSVHVHVLTPGKIAEGLEVLRPVAA